MVVQIFYMVIIAPLGMRSHSYILLEQFFNNKLMSLITITAGICGRDWEWSLLSCVSLEDAYYNLVVELAGSLDLVTGVFNVDYYCCD